MSTTPLTDQQRQAVTLREVSVVLSSGAGCGKTHVLTERYLSHLEMDGAEVGQIVAITFTERAAREMRGRIRGEVSRRLRGAITDTEAEKWTHHLRDLEAAPISTIHAFCGTLLRQHAVEAGLDARFDILEQVLTLNLETEAMQTCLQQLLTAQSTAGEDLRQLVLLFGWRSVSEGIRGLLSAWDGPRWQHWLELSPEMIAADWLDQARRVIVPHYVAYLLAGQPAIAHCLTLLKRHPPQEGPLVASVQQLHEAVSPVSYGARFKCCR